MVKIKLHLHNKPKLKEAPLADIYDFDNREQLRFYDKNSLAYNKDESYKAKAKLLWRDVPDNWYLISVKAIDRAPGKILYNEPLPYTEEQLKSFLDSKNIPQNSKILVVGTTPITNDFDSPAWQTAHDIIGHAIDGPFSKNIYDFYSRLYLKYGHGFNFSDFDWNGITWSCLPPQLRLSTVKGEDIMPDIFFGIFSRSLSKEKTTETLAKQMIPILEKGYFKSKETINFASEALELANDYFHSLENCVKDFIDSFENGVPKFVSSF